MAYYGVYRGIVMDSNDPMGTGRAMVSVPTLGQESWALVALPPTQGPAARFPVGASVIVAFEQGDVSRPVILGQVGGPGASSGSRK